MGRIFLFLHVLGAVLFLGNIITTTLLENKAGPQQRAGAAASYGAKHYARRLYFHRSRHRVSCGVRYINGS